MPKTEKLSLKQRLKIINDFQNFTCREISEIHKIELKIVQNTIKRKNYYLALPSDRVKKRFLDIEWLRKVEEAIFEHIKFLTSVGQFVSGSTIQKIARRYAKDQGVQFYASNGWLENLKKRFNFCLPLHPYQFFEKTGANLSSETIVMMV